MNLLLAFLLSLFGASLDQAPQQTSFNQATEPGKSQQVQTLPTYSKKGRRPDPGSSHGPIIIIDDTHFKKYGHN